MHYLGATALLLAIWHFVRVGNHRAAAFLASKIQDRPADRPTAARLNVATLADDEFVGHFRFRREHVAELVRLLQLPEEVHSAHGHRADRVTAFCMFLYRCSQAKTWAAQSEFFGVGARAQRGICDAVVTHVVARWGHLLTFPDHLKREPTRYLKCVCAFSVRVSCCCF